MSIRCNFTVAGGQPCKRWAVRGGQFCFNHQPPAAAAQTSGAVPLHPLDRLSTPKDVFDVLREVIAAVRRGHLSPGQGYCIGFLAQLLLKVRQEARIHQRQQNLYHQMLGGLDPDEAALDANPSLDPATSLSVPRAASEGPSQASDDRSPSVVAAGLPHPASTPPSPDLAAKTTAALSSGSEAAADPDELAARQIISHFTSLLHGPAPLHAKAGKASRSAAR